LVASAGDSAAGKQGLPQNVATRTAKTVPQGVFMDVFTGGSDAARPSDIEVPPVLIDSAGRGMLDCRRDV
jgi:hypothetical protein